MPQPLSPGESAPVEAAPAPAPPPLPRRPPKRQGLESPTAPPVVSSATPQRFSPWRPLSAGMVSLLVHLGLILLLALAVLARPAPVTVDMLHVDTRPETDDQQLVFPEEMHPVDALQLSISSMMQLESEVLDEVTELKLDEEMATAALDVRPPEHRSDLAPASELIRPVGALAGEALEGRGDRLRGDMVTKYGGTAGSERAVALALKWFAEHQNRDGSWTFDLRRSPCGGECSQHGQLDRCFTAATALALLPFLGAGQTHQQGQYKEHVHNGLRYLLRVQDRRSGSLVSPGGTLYSHGVSTIALCEAYAMTREAYLKEPAQAAVNFICRSQNPSGGGWRYLPLQAGDTSVVGWQLMALKSGHMGYLNVPRDAVHRVSGFLDRVQSDEGALYGYNSRLPRPSTTAAGLLCRMYLGWDRQEAALARGIRSLSNLGPARSEADTMYHMYYNFYATQVMRHYGGEPWEKWNATLRDYLVATQVSSGHMTGSWTIPAWTPPPLDTDMGGRLYYTSLATMILEVYYRYMPIYGEAAADQWDETGE